MLREDFVIQTNVRRMLIRSNIDYSEITFLEALSLNPKYREATLNLGFLYIELRRWKEAEDLFLSEARRHPKDGFLHHALGVLYLQTERQKEALVHIRKAIQYHPYYTIEIIIKRKGFGTEKRFTLIKKEKGPLGRFI
jgi:tetratricopeptide (TPR) repeat protein